MASTTHPRSCPGSNSAPMRAPPAQQQADVGEDMLHYAYMRGCQLGSAEAPFTSLRSALAVKQGLLHFEKTDRTAPEILWLKPKV